jgi:hypothetical protein
MTRILSSSDVWHQNLLLQQGKPAQFTENVALFCFSRRVILTPGILPVNSPSEYTITRQSPSDFRSYPFQNSWAMMAHVGYRIF